MGNRGQALITGASGFIGSHLARKLSQDGWSIRCLIRESSSRDRLPREGVELLVGDMGDRGSLDRSLKGVTTVFHLAGQIRARSRQEFFRANREGTKNLLKAARRAGTVERFIFVSSLSAAGPSPDGHPLREDEPPRPVSLYGESKLAAEMEALKFARDFTITILRPAAVYGPGDRETLQVIKLVNRGLKFQPGGPGFKFSSLHVADAVEGIRLAAERSPGKPAVYFLSDGNYYRWEETLDLLKNILRKKFPSLKIPWSVGKTWLSLAGKVFPRSEAAFYLDKVREMSHKYWLCDTGRIQSELRFAPGHDLKTGLRETIAWYRTAGWL
jgi:nucleoside-diphosphate-sugar epimerase